MFQNPSMSTVMFLVLKSPIPNQQSCTGRRTVPTSTVWLLLEDLERMRFWAVEVSHFWRNHRRRIADCLLIPTKRAFGILGLIHSTTPCLWTISLLSIFSLHKITCKSWSIGCVFVVVQLTILLFLKERISKWTKRSLNDLWGQSASVLDYFN